LSLIRERSSSPRSSASSCRLDLEDHLHLDLLVVMQIVLEGDVGAVASTESVKVEAGPDEVERLKKWLVIFGIIVPVPNLLWGMAEIVVPVFFELQILAEFICSDRAKF